MRANMIPVVVGALRNSTQWPGEKSEESRNNDKCRVASEDCTPWNSTHTQKPEKGTGV